MKATDLKEISELKIADGIVAKIITTATMSIAHVTLSEGAILPEHSHHHEQVVNVIAGELELTVDGTVNNLTPGTVMVLPPNMPHSGRAVTECKVIDVFHPIREDFRGTAFGGYAGSKK